MAGSGGKYDITLDPLWNGESAQEAVPFGKEEIVFYQCDHLGTPMELTDHDGKVAWSAQYKAWGYRKGRSAGQRARRGYGMRNGFRASILKMRYGFSTIATDIMIQILYDIYLKPH
jgi:hypothetical protein